MAGEPLRSRSLFTTDGRMSQLLSGCGQPEEVISCHNPPFKLMLFPLA